ncbi:hypothetical protein AVEN_148605-1 [Araneus ventricosus]|uniref:Uncharacterized protein n=1 Tax=Araneus ventricosus TaxID=182803 RepID=A0A4Y2PHX8_ARAVE|nr:hypothetical protein AVEN_148605-1 [Araneus ventricosus]
MVYLAASTTGGSHTNGLSGSVYHWWLTHGMIYLGSVYSLGEATQHDSSGGVHGESRTEWFIMRRSPLVLTQNSIWRRVRWCSQEMVYPMAASTTGWLTRIVYHGARTMVAHYVI